MAISQQLPQTNHASIDDVIEESLENFGWAQAFQTFLVALASLFEAQYSFISVYTNAQPTWHCIDNSLCNSSSKLCEIPKFSWAWDDHSSKTIVSDWGLECSSSFIRGLPTSFNFIGCILGGIFLSIFVDSLLGRKKLLFFSCLIMSVSAMLTALSTNIWMYTVIRLISGIGRGSLGTCTMVLLTERVGKSWRGRVGVVYYVFFSFGTLSLPALAFATRKYSWRLLHLSTGIPVFIYCIIVYQFAVESPRWLFMRGYNKEAAVALKQISSKIDERLIVTDQLQLHGETSTNFSSSIKQFFERKWVFWRLIVLSLYSFADGIAYYRLMLGVGQLEFNLYLSALFNGLAEMSSHLITFYMLEKCNRKISIVSTSLMGAMGFILTWVVVGGRRGPSGGVLQLALELCSLLGIYTAYSILVVYSVELFPTCVRNFVTTTIGQANLLGGVVSPVLIYATSAGGINFLSYGFLGCCLIVCGMLVLFLPETKGKPLTDSMEDQERLENKG